MRYSAGRKPLAAVREGRWARRTATLIVCLAGAAGAQEPAAVAAMRADVRFHAAAEKIFREYEASLTSQCTEIHPDWTRATHQVYGKIATDAQGYLSNATWAETVPGTACGEPRRFRTLVVVREGKAGVDRMLPGESNAGALLEKDARLTLVGAAALHVPNAQPGCRLDVLDTNIVGHKVPVGREPWSEVWLVRFCGRKLEIPITFVPDAVGGGTSFNVEQKKVVEVR